MPNDNLSVVSIITVNYNGRRFLDACFDSLLVVDYPRELLEIIMVDNGSEDDSVRYVNERFPSVKVLKNEKNNYSQANNLGIRSSRGKYVVFINNDVVVERDWLKELVRCAEADPLIGAVGSKILLKNGKVQSLGLTQFPNFYWGDICFHVKDSDKFNEAEELVAISGCAALYRKECLEAIGIFDEDFNMYLEDVDLGIRCRKNGWKLLICPASIIHHEFHGTIGTEENARRRQEANRLLLVAKHWPDKLVEAIWQGRKYFASMPGALRVQRDKELAEALGKAIVKLRKEHGMAKAEAIEKDILLMQQTVSPEDNTNISDELSPVDKEISRRDERIVQLSLALERQDALWAKRLSKEIERLSKEIANRDERIVQLSLALEQQDALWAKRLSKEIANRDERIVELSRILERKDVEIIQKDESIEYTHRRVGLLEGELRRVHTSTGYRYFFKPMWDIIFPFKQAARNLAKFINRLKELWHHSYGPHNWEDAYFKHLNYGTYPPYPETAVLMLTKRCNLHCVFCDITNTKEEMGFEDAQKVIDNVSRLKATLLVITGGEPFLHPQLFDIVKYAKNKGLKVCITTNGTLIDEYFDEIVDSRVDVLSVSLDGLGPIHDTLRNKLGLAEKVKEAILRVKKLEPKGQTASINFVVTNKNLIELEEVYRWAQKENIFMDFWPVNFHPELNVNINDEYAKLLKFITQLKVKGELSAEKYNYFLNIPLYCGSKKHLRVRCLALIRQFGIDVDGSVRICCVWGFKHEDLGNAIRDNLEELWHSSKYRQVRRALYYHGCNAGCYNNALHQFTGITGKNFIVSGR